MVRGMEKYCSLVGTVRGFEFLDFYKRFYIIYCRCIVRYMLEKITGSRLKFPRELWQYT